MPAPTASAASAPATAAPLVAPTAVAIPAARTATLEESAWFDAVERVGKASDFADNKLQGYLASPPSVTEAEWADARASVAQATSDYRRTPVPAPLVKADYLLSQSLSEADSAYNFAELAVKTQDRAAIDKAIQHVTNYRDLTRKTSEEIKRWKQGQ